MRPTYKFGSTLNMFFFFTKVLAATIMGLVVGKYPFYLMLAFFGVTVLIGIFICVAVKKQRISEKLHKNILSFSFTVVDLFLGFAFDSAQVMLYSMILTSVTLFTFIDDRLMKFHAVHTYIFQVICILLIHIILNSPQSVLEMNIGVITNVVANWVFIGMIYMIVFKNRQYAEQERSLDDMLTLIEAKCDDARAATKAKSIFLATMSHEIRTPINAIMGMNETILRDSNEKQIKEYAIETKSAAESLLGIVNDILDITKIEEQKIKLIDVRYSPAAMITDIYNLIKFRAQTKNLELILDIGDNLPTEVTGDDVRLKQILVNLLTNAVKYTHTGSVTFTVKRTDRDMFLFSVKDTGIGIKPENMATLFDSFARMDEEKNRNIEGTGLGLNIASSLLKIQNSELKVKSEYGIGSEFYFTLKQKVTDDTPIGKYDPAAHGHTYKEFVNTFIAPGAKILLVDDNAINRKVFINLLKPMQMDITEADSGKACIELVKENHYDIIFMDHMMPELDGIETFEIMKEMPDNMSKDTPVVMVTANAMSGANEMYKKAGFRSMLTKPLNPSKLEKKILTLLPPHYIKDAEQGTEVNDATKEELPIIRGIDWRVAGLNLGDNEAILGTVKMFVSAIGSDTDELNGYYSDIAQGEDIAETMKSYRVKVHSMKSSAMLIGIISLSGMAMRLEQAAQEEDKATILSLHPVFTDSWLSFKKPLSELIGVNASDKEKADMSVIREIIEEIKKAATLLDVDALDELSARLDSYSYEDEETEKKIEDIRTAIFNFETYKLKDISI
ncbi:MAG: response regulator [Ruminiclostridium sp.]|nr:response regulator [Ruminiclostridium sp.]